MVEFTQDLVNTYIENWIGVSAISRENNTPGFFRLYFPDQKTAFKSFVFIEAWKDWQPEKQMVLSVIKENEAEYSFYIYKQNRPEFIKGTFSKNLNLDIKNLESFIKTEQGGKFMILASYPDENNNIIDNVSQKIILFENLEFKTRSEVKENNLENN